MAHVFIADTETITECLCPPKYDRHVVDWRRDRWLCAQKAWNDEAMARVAEGAALIILRAKAGRATI